MGFHILLGVTGSVAAVKVPELVVALKEFAEVRVVSTTRGSHFFTLSDDTQILSDDKEWLEFQKVGDPVLHIELRKWADLMIIAPLDANSLAKISMGICDNLLTSIVRAWDWENDPMLLAPAMNTLMWSHPLTTPQLETVTKFSKNKKCQIIPPVSKKLACGDIGIGALASVETIVAEAKTIYEETLS